MCYILENLKLRGPEHIYLMEEHFAQTLNETEHLEYMESRAVVLIGWIALSPDTLYLSTIGVTWFITGSSSLCLPSLLRGRDSCCYNVCKVSCFEWYDDKILEILNDELEHSRELQKQLS